jgi:hypothetical protein
MFFAPRDEKHRAQGALLQKPCPKWRRPRQPHPGTRIIRYRCFLPDLAEFANYRRGGTDGATMDVGSEALKLF